MAVKDSFLLFTKYRKQIEMLDMEERGEVLTAIYVYADEGEVIHFTSAKAELLFSVIQGDMDYNAEKYEEKCEKNKENGQRGGRPRKSAKKEENRTVIEEEKEKPKKPNGFSENRTVISKTLYDNDYEYDNDNEDNNITPLTPQKGAKGAKPSPTGLQIEIVNSDEQLSAEMKSAVIEWLKHHSQRSKPYQDIGFNKLLALIKQKVKDHGEKEVIGIIDLSIANGYQGIVWDKLAKGRAAPGRSALKNRSPQDSFASAGRDLNGLVE